ncbi:hypothetical protein MAH1_12470 [Sessilibacter sp. MAH1]
MKNLILLSLVTALAFSSSQSFALGKGKNFNVNQSRTTVNGTFNRNIQRQTNENGFTKSRSATLPNGQSKSRVKEVSVDQDTQTATKTVNGTRLNGESYSKTSQATRTENGYATSSSRTGIQGNTVSKNTNASYDKDSGTVTKNKEFIDAQGQSHTSTTTRTVTTNQSE